MLDIPVIGIDAAFAHMGLCHARINWGTHPDNRIQILDLHLVNTDKQNKKTVRKSSDDLRRAQELVSGLKSFCLRQPSGLPARVAFAEVPSGSKSSTAARGLGIAVGVLASCPVTVIEVSQLEVKLASVGKRSASKAEIIAWAVAKFPKAPWLRHNGKITQANEHLADAVAIIHAGINTVAFQTVMSMNQPTHRVSIPRTRII